MGRGKLCIIVHMEATVSQMSIAELRHLITDVVSDVVEQKLSHYADPDAGLELRDDFQRMLVEHSERVARGEERLIPAEQVYKELGLD